jgi:NEDD8-activating enzyme E1 regulatory subunit
LVRSSFIGTIQIQIVEHQIIEAHPDDALPDLRLDRPINVFRDHCNSIDMNSLTRDEHLHLPSIVILFKTLQIWQQQTNRTDLPSLRKDKDAFKLILDQLSHHSAYDTQDRNRSLENFDEAKRIIPSRLVRTSIPSNVQNLFQDASCLQLSDQSSIFWFIIHAMKCFTENEGQGLLPVRGDVPDMITNTNSYVQLVKIYQEQAKIDCDIVHNYLVQSLRVHNRFTSLTANEQTNLHELVQLYCKNAAFIKVSRTRELKNEDDALRKQIEQLPFEPSIDEPEPDICW